MIFDKLPKPFFVLAPMDDVTDTVFRQIIADCGAPDLFFTEFVNVDGLQSPGRPKLLPKLRFTPKETPIIAQIWGNIPENYRKTVGELKDMGFAGVDINMGCPVKSAVKNGSCAALIDNRELAKEIIVATREGAGASLDSEFPISVKTRIGFNKVDITWIEFLLNQGLDALIVHGRTAKQMSKVPADWEIIGQISKMRDKLSPTTKIIGNGDVINKDQGYELAKKYKLDGIMIGRGVFHDPYVFASSPAGESQWHTFSKQQKLALYEKHVKLFDATWKDRKRRIKTLNKFCKIYINDFEGAKEMRENLMHAESTNELLSLISESYS